MSLDKKHSFCLQNMDIPLTQDYEEDISHCYTLHTELERYPRNTVLHTRWV